MATSFKNNPDSFSNPIMPKTDYNDCTYRDLSDLRKLKLIELKAIDKRMKCINMKTGTSTAGGGAYEPTKQFKTCEAMDIPEYRCSKKKIIISGVLLIKKTDLIRDKNGCYLGVKRKYGKFKREITKIKPQ